MLAGPIEPCLFAHEAERGIGLGIKVDQQDLLSLVPREMGRKIDPYRRLADAPLHVHE